MNRQDAKHAKNAKEVAVEWRDYRIRLDFVLTAAWRLGGSIFRIGNTQLPSTRYLKKTCWPEAESLYNPLTRLERIRERG